MSFKNISCQDRIIESFRNAIRTDRLAHAYIFTGREGTGKMLFSRELAKAVFCRHAEPDACDQCERCRKVDDDNFPDLWAISPEKNSRVIKLEQLKSLQEFLNTKPLDAKRKVVIIQSADSMNEEASNCLLKTLEEPPPYALLLLITTSIELVQETVRSRCQIIRFSPLGINTIKNILVSRFQMDQKEAWEIASISNGSAERAVLLSSEHIIEKKGWFVNRIMSLGINDNLSFAKELFVKWHIQETDVLEQKRLHIKELLLLFLMYYRDLLICKTGDYNLSLYYDNQKEVLVARSQSFSEDTLFRIIQVIETSFRYLNQNANITLLLENMITRVLHLQSRHSRNI